MIRRGRLAPRRYLWTLLLTTAFAACAWVVGLGQAPQKSVLVLFAVRRDGPSAVDADHIFQQVIGGGLDGRLDYYSEYLDLARFPGTVYPDAVRQFLRSKYHGQKFDLLLAVGSAALDVAGRYRDEVASPGTPIVFRAIAPPSVAPRVTGLVAQLNLKRSLDAALALQPDTQRVIVVGGASAFDRFYEDLAREQFKPLEGRVRFQYLSGMPIKEIRRQIGALPAHSIIFFTTLAEDGEGQKFLPFEILDSLSADANAPIFSWSATTLGHGVVGGQLLSNQVVSTRLAELALRVLRGEDPQTIQVADIDWTVGEFDWRQLRRWGIDDARLPSGSAILFGPVSVWAQYRPYVVGGSLLVLLQTAFIAALLVQRRRRRRAERALRESEERFRLMADTAPVLVWRAGIDKGCDFFNRPWLEFTGRTMEQEFGNGWADGVHPDDLDGCLRVYVTSFDARQPFRMEYRLRRADGEYRWLLDNGVPRSGPDGAFAGYIGSCVDITDYKDAEDRLQESQRLQQRLAGRLISAQEYERARIARDLHDDINQQLAGLAISLSGLKRRVGSVPGDRSVADDLSVLHDRTTAVAEDIRHLSHGLHPSALAHAGLIAALSAHCRDLQRQHPFKLTFTAEGDFEGADPATLLCLFRVAQEALRNVATHANARHATVNLRRVGDKAELTVADDGKGFDIRQVRGRSEGLGLVSIQERTRLAGGTVSIVTELGKGTEVHVRVPITPTTIAGPRAPSTMPTEKRGHGPS